MLQGTDQTEVSEGRSRGWTQFTVMLVQHYDENHRLEVTPQRPIPPPVYFLIWPSCVIKEGSASYLGLWTAVWSGSLSQARQLSPPVLGFNSTVSAAQVQVPPSCSVSRHRCLSVSRWRSCAARSQPGGVRGANRQLFGGYSVTGEEGRGAERDLTLISCRRRFSALPSCPR